MTTVPVRLLCLAVPLSACAGAGSSLPEPQPEALVWMPPPPGLHASMPVVRPDTMRVERMPVLRPDPSIDRRMVVPLAPFASSERLLSDPPSRAEPRRR